MNFWLLAYLYAGLGPESVQTDLINIRKRAASLNIHASQYRSGDGRLIRLSGWCLLLLNVSSAATPVQAFLLSSATCVTLQGLTAYAHGSQDQVPQNLVALKLDQLLLLRMHMVPTVLLLVIFKSLMDF